MTPQEEREELAGGEWTVICDSCIGVFVQIQRHEPLSCQSCRSGNIEVIPGKQEDK